MGMPCHTRASLIKVGIFRLRNSIRFANRIAKLKMTTWLNAESDCKVPTADCYSTVTDFARFLG
jgi:hypothetical protein